MNTARKGSAWVLMTCALGAVAALAPTPAAADGCAPGNVCAQVPIVTVSGTSVSISGALQVCANEPPAPPECVPANPLPVALGQTGVGPGPVGVGYTLPDAFSFNLTASAGITLTYCVNGACTTTFIGVAQTGLTAANLPGESIVPSAITCPDGTPGTQIDVTVTTASSSLWVNGFQVPVVSGGSFTKSFDICR